LDAKTKAEDFVMVLGQKVGKALMIFENSVSYTPQPQLYVMRSMAMNKYESTTEETIAIGEIEIIANISVRFVLE
jgi:uncharacterized protein